MENTKKKLKKTPNVYHFPIESPAELRKHLCKPAELHSFIRITFSAFSFWMRQRKMFGERTPLTPAALHGILSPAVPRSSPASSKAKEDMVFCCSTQEPPTGNSMFQSLLLFEAIN